MNSLLQQIPSTNLSRNLRIGCNIQCLYDDEWYAATVAKFAPTGIRVKFVCDGAFIFIPNGMIESQIRIPEKNSSSSLDKKTSDLNLGNSSIKKMCHRNDQTNHGSDDGEERTNSRNEHSHDYNPPEYSDKPKENAKKFVGFYKTKENNYQVKIQNGSNFCLGTCSTEVEAAKMYDKYVVKHKLPRRINFPSDYPNHVFKIHPTTQYMNVQKYGNSFLAMTHVNNQKIYIGVYATAEEAARARDDYVVKHKLDRVLNFPHRDEMTDHGSKTQDKRRKISSNPNTPDEKSRNFFGVQKTKSNRYRVLVSPNFSIDGSIYCLGTFTIDVEAARVYDKYVVDHKLAKKINFPSDYPNRVFETSDSSTQYVGVQKYTRSYLAITRENNKQRVYIGLYDTAEEAARARDDYVVKHNLNRVLNFPNVKSKQQR